MQKLIILLFVSIFSIDYLTDIAKVINSKFSLLPEFLSAIALLLIIGNLAKNKLLMLDIKYIILFLFFGIHIINGIVVNGFSAGSIVAGSRVYFKYMPFFLISSVYLFSDTQIRQQLKLLLILLLLQAPIAFLQKFILFSEKISGDYVRGSLTTSSFLTIILLCSITMVLGFYLKNKISFRKLIIIIFILFLPTTINETKSTLLLLPIAIFVPVMVMKLQGELKQGVIKIFIAVSLLFICFVSVYDAFWGDRYGEGGSIIDFYSDERKIAKYLAPKTSGIVTNENAALGRIDGMVAPIKTLGEKGFVSLIIGLGIGGVTDTPFDELSGQFIKYRDDGLVSNSISYLLWEIGILGVVLSFVFMIMIFRDSKKLSKGDGLENIIGLGWVGVVTIILFSLLYKDVLPVNSLMYLFWYFSGYVVSSRYIQKYNGHNVI